MPILASADVEMHPDAGTTSSGKPRMRASNTAEPEDVTVMTNSNGTGAYGEAGNEV